MPSSFRHFKPILIKYQTSFVTIMKNPGRARLQKKFIIFKKSKNTVFHRITTYSLVEAPEQQERWIRTKCHRKKFKGHMQNVSQLQKLQTYLKKVPNIVCHHQEKPMARATMKKIIIFQKSKNTLFPPTTTHTDSIHPNGPVKTIKCRRKKLKRREPYAKWIQRLQTYPNKPPNIVCHHHEHPRARGHLKKFIIFKNGKNNVKYTITTSTANFRTNQEKA